MYVNLEGNDYVTVIMWTRPCNFVAVSLDHWWAEDVGTIDTVSDVLFSSAISTDNHKKIEESLLQRTETELLHECRNFFSELLISYDKVNK